MGKAVFIFWSYKNEDFSVRMKCSSAALFLIGCIFETFFMGCKKRWRGRRAKSDISMVLLSEYLWNLWHVAFTPVRCKMIKWNHTKYFQASHELACTVCCGHEQRAVFLGAHNWCHHKTVQTWMQSHSETTMHSLLPLASSHSVVIFTF